MSSRPLDQTLSPVRLNAINKGPKHWDVQRLILRLYSANVEERFNTTRDLIQMAKSCQHNKSIQTLITNALKRIQCTDKESLILDILSKFFDTSTSTLWIQDQFPNIESNYQSNQREYNETSQDTEDLVLIVLDDKHDSSVQSPIPLPKSTSYRPTFSADLCSGHTSENPDPANTMDEMSNLSSPSLNKRHNPTNFMWDNVDYNAKKLALNMPTLQPTVPSSQLELDSSFNPMHTGKSSVDPVLMHPMQLNAKKVLARNFEKTSIFSNVIQPNVNSQVQSTLPLASYHQPVSSSQNTLSTNHHPKTSSELNQNNSSFSLPSIYSSRSISNMASKSSHSILQHTSDPCQKRMAGASEHQLDSLASSQPIFLHDKASFHYQHSLKNSKKNTIGKNLPKKSEAAQNQLIDYLTSKGYQKMSVEQQKVIECICRGQSLFFTGAAGTGKSYVLREVIRILSSRLGDGQVQVTAPTGIAAVAINGCTIYSFAGIGLGKEPVDILVSRIQKNHRSKKRWLDVKVLIVDEISMLSAELFDKLESIARQVRHSKLPFGGIQVILCGDFFQLPPIASTSLTSSSSTSTPNDQGIFCFQGSSWSKVVKVNICLNQVFRQSGDIQFIDILNQVRIGNISDQSYQDLLTCMNTRWNDGIEPTRLYPLKYQVEKQNLLHLEQIPEEPVIFKANDTTLYPTSNYLKQLQDSCPAPAELVLKIGAQVVLLKNLDVEGEFVNGFRGVVISFLPNNGYESNVPSSKMRFHPVVMFENSKQKLILPDKFSIKVSNEEVASREQIPLSLAWALSIHKSQGMTLSRLEVSLKSVFEYGQAYVALSRVTSMAGLRILDPFPREIIRSHPSVVAFYNSINAI